MHRVVKTLLILTFVSGCAEIDARRSTPAETSSIPVSFNDVMVALVNDAADPIWVAAWRNPDTEADWRNLERNAFRLKIAGALLNTPATGPMDATWAADPKWRSWSRALTEASTMAIAAVQRRDVVAIGKAGDRIVEVCEGCHIDFKLPLPTGGKFGELSPTSSDFDGDR